MTHNRSLMSWRGIVILALLAHSPWGCSEARKYVDRSGMGGTPGIAGQGGNTPGREPAGNGGAGGMRDSTLSGGATVTATGGAGGTASSAGGTAGSAAGGSNSGMGHGGVGGSEQVTGTGGSPLGLGGTNTGGIPAAGSGGTLGSGGHTGSGGLDGSGGAASSGGTIGPGGSPGGASGGNAGQGGNSGGTSGIGGTSGSGGTIGCNVACGARTICDTGSCVPARRVFVSSSAVTPDFGGALGADGKCQTFANLAGLGGSWRAWVSDSTTSPSQRFSLAGVPYRLLDGTIVAANWTALVSGALSGPIDKDEFAGSKAGKEVWTATKADGTLAADGCSGFTSASMAASPATVGIAGNSDMMWTTAYVQFCDRINVRLYCFEQ